MTQTEQGEPERRASITADSVALMMGRYHGQPMRMHMGLPVSRAHFDRWLELFETTAAEVCPPAAAEHFIERARRIADSLELGIATAQGRIAAPCHSRPQSTQSDASLLSGVACSG